MPVLTGFRFFFYGLVSTCMFCAEADSWGHIEDDKLKDQIQTLDQKMYMHTRKFLQAEADEHKEEIEAKADGEYNPMLEKRAAENAKIAANEFTDANEERVQANKIHAEEQEPKIPGRTQNQRSTQGSSFPEGWSFITGGIAIYLLVGFVRGKSSGNDKRDLEAFKESLLDPSQEEVMNCTVWTPVQNHPKECLVSESNAVPHVVEGDPASYMDEPPTDDDGNESEIRWVQGSLTASRTSLDMLESIKDGWPDLAQERTDDQAVEPSASESDSADSNLAARIQSAVENLANQEKNDEAEEFFGRPQSDTSEPQSEPQSEPDSRLRGCSAPGDRIRSRSNSSSGSTSSADSEDSEEIKMSDERSYGDHTDLPRETSELPASSSVIANFSVWCDSRLGDDLRVIGNMPALGQWQPKMAPSMQCVDGYTWVAKVELEFPPDYKWAAIDKPLEYKYVWMAGGREPTWEPCENRVLCQPRSGCSMILRNVWGRS